MLDIMRESVHDAGMKSRKCLDKCLAAHPSSPCDCSCGGACHSRGECDKEAHRFSANGQFRRPTTGPFRVQSPQE